jgi:hypothetical protein
MAKQYKTNMQDSTCNWLTACAARKWSCKFCGQDIGTNNNCRTRTKAKTRTRYKVVQYNNELTYDVF